MKTLVFLGFATSVLLNLAPQAQAGVIPQKHPATRIACITRDKDARPGSCGDAGASSATVRDDAELFRSLAERTMNNPG